MVVPWRRRARVQPRGAVRARPTRWSAAIAPHARHRIGSAQGYESSGWPGPLLPVAVPHNMDVAVMNARARVGVWVWVYVCVCAVPHPSRSATIRRGQPRVSVQSAHGECVDDCSRGLANELIVTDGISQISWIWAARSWCTLPGSVRLVRPPLMASEAGLGEHRFRAVGERGLGTDP